MEVPEGWAVPSIPAGVRELVFVPTVHYARLIEPVDGRGAWSSQAPDGVYHAAAELMGDHYLLGKGGYHDRLPLPADVGEAVATYLCHHRLPCTTRRVFIRTKAPHRVFSHPSSISTIVRRAMNRAGLRHGFKGAHILRHSLATGMLRAGASLGEIGEVLRHRVPSTTEIYAKVDIQGLRSLALPWPTEGSEP